MKRCSMMTVIGIAAVAVLGTGVRARATEAKAGGTPEDVERRARAAIRKGLDYLKSVQKEDGSWSNGNFPALTALGLWAFARSEHPDKAAVCKKAAEFVGKHARDDGSIYKPAGLGRRSGGLSTYNTAVCMIALHAHDRKEYAPQILKARKFVAESQLQGDSPGAGGFGYDKNPPFLHKVIGAVTGRRNRADLSNTAWAARAIRLTQDLEDLREGEEKVDIDWEAALAFVEELQIRDKDDPTNYGSFGYEKGGSRGGTRVKKDGTVALRGYGSMTYAGIESMIYAQVDRNDPRVRSALAWAAQHWSVDENPGMGTRGLFYYYNIMGKALSLHGSSILTSPDGKTIPWQKQIVEKLAAMQAEDGSWVNENNQFWEGDSALVTAYAILTLQYAIGR